MDSINTSNFFSPLTDLHTPIFTKQTVTYSGIGHTLDPNNLNLFPILLGSDTSYSIEGQSVVSDTPNEKISLVSGL